MTVAMVLERNEECTFVVKKNGVNCGVVRTLRGREKGEGVLRPLLLPRPSSVGTYRGGTPRCARTRPARRTLSVYH